MSNQPENQQYKNPQVPPVVPKAKDDDYKKYRADQGKKEMPGTKNPGIDSDEDDDADSQDK